MSDHHPLVLASSEQSKSRGDLALLRASRDAGHTHADPHLSDYARVLYKRRWTACSVLVLVFVSVVVYTFSATPMYEARAQLLIETENQNVVSFKEVIEQEKATNDYYQTQYRILQSRQLARKVLDRLKRWDKFDPTKTTRPSGFSQMISSAASSVSGLMWPAKPVETRAADENDHQFRAIDRFLANLSIVPIRNSRLVDIQYVSAEPEIASSVANALAQTYIEQNLEFKYTSSRDASDWLGRRLAEQRKQVEASEAALQQYRETNDAVSLEERQNIVVQKLADLNAAVTRAKTERIQKEAAYNQLVAIQHDRTALDTVPMILSNTFVQQQKTELADLQRQQAQLSEKLGDNHPDMIKNRSAIRTAEARIQGEIAKGVESMKNDYQTALAQEKSLMQALDQQKQDALALNRKGIDYGVIQRDAATNRQIFDTLMQRAKETTISGELKTSNIRIVDSAELPRTPATPNRKVNILIGLFGGSALAIGVAFFFDYFDNRIKSPTEIKVHLGVPFLGMIPSVEEMTQTTGSPLLSNGVKPNFAEAFRIVRTNLLFSSVHDGARTIVVTSSGPGEGKTLVASNLALSLGQTGQRVLLIDGDMRRPRAHDVFDLPQEPGLSNLLVGNAKTSDAVRQTQSKGLWVLPAGRTPPNPAELLGSGRFKEFLATVGEHFDWVVIDSPPVMAVADAPIIAHLASSVVFVVGAEMTSRTVAQTAVEQIHAVNGRVVGAILNRVDLEHNAYYYSQYYRREYGEYYTKAAV